MVQKTRLSSFRFILVKEMETQRERDKGTVLWTHVLEPPYTNKTQF